MDIGRTQMPVLAAELDRGPTEIDHDLPPISSQPSLALPPACTVPRQPVKPVADPDNVQSSKARLNSLQTSSVIVVRSPGLASVSQSANVPSFAVHIEQHD